jgi:hypothetical protein
VSSSRQLSNYRARIHHLHMSYFIIFIAYPRWIISFLIWFILNFIFFSISSFSISFFLYFFLIFFFSKGLSWYEKYRKSWLLSFSNRRSNEWKNSQILGVSTRRDNYRKLSSSIIQEKMHRKVFFKGTNKIYIYALTRKITA